MSTLPLISIVTPSLNQAQYLEEAIQSVLQQGYPRLEYIIMDGGSTDGSVDIIRRHAPQLAHWVSAPDAGQADAINQGWHASTGTVLGWLNADDRLRPGALDQVGRAFTDTPQPAMVIGGTVHIDERGEVIGERPVRRLGYLPLLLSRTYPQPSVFLNRRVLATVGLLRTDLHLVFDWEYWLRVHLAHPPGEIQFLDELLSDNRIWAGAKTRRARHGPIATERRQALRDLYSQRTLPPEWEALRQEAIAATYWRQAHLWRESGHGLQAVRCLRQAHRIAPETFPWSVPWGLEFWLHTYFPYPFWRLPYWALRKVLGPLWPAGSGRQTKTVP